MKLFFKSLIRSPGGMIGLALITVFVFCAIFAPVIAPEDPMEQSLADRFTPLSTLWNGMIVYRILLESIC